MLDAVNYRDTGKSMTRLSTTKQDFFRRLIRKCAHIAEMHCACERDDGSWDGGVGRLPVQLWLG